jgi:hypothetical protein
MLPGLRCSVPIAAGYWRHMHEAAEHLAVTRRLRSEESTMMAVSARSTVAELWLYCSPEPSKVLGWSRRTLKLRDAPPSPPSNQPTAASNSCLAWRKVKALLHKASFKLQGSHGVCPTPIHCLGYWNTPPTRPFLCPLSAIAPQGTLESCIIVQPTPCWRMLRPPGRTGCLRAQVCWERLPCMVPICSWWQHGQFGTLSAAVYTDLLELRA